MRIFLRSFSQHFETWRVCVCVCVCHAKCRQVGALPTNANMCMPFYAKQKFFLVVAKEQKKKFGRACLHAMQGHLKENVRAT
ncbi:hypothetical protein DUNSADRAFT_1476 [Dunaliella salina]|uniref:Secreted protein n=1 Tax=Dunaliella salina TaxID=3046 RepID=A0ABQ7FXE7_DUNSA|nr:hypothetical protein DUNSADRAFT_1476 [Dunaliella salina]|eukprot:KAF5827031.1 hypothetical protein DUNSADRAFT_1476 [Dunaliella salina]